MLLLFPYESMRRQMVSLVSASLRYKQQQMTNSKVNNLFERVNAEHYETPVISTKLE